MTTEQLEIHGTTREDGYVFFTSPDIPGFRLLLEAREDVDAYSNEVLSAIRGFYPLVKEAEARRKANTLVMAARPSARKPSPISFDFLTCFATGAA